MKKYKKICIQSDEILKKILQYDLGQITIFSLFNF